MKKYPFKFLDSYNHNDTDIFFGRDEEIKALYEMVFQNPILLIYGASGTGKTSLIQCGLAGKFKSYDWLALTVRRGSNINASLEKILNDAGGSNGTDDDTLNAKPLTGLQKLIRNVYLRSFKPIYLIFDQFEELYILGNREEQGKFIQAVKEILATEQPVKIIISIREEYLGRLYEFERAVPQLLRKKLRVEPMNIDKVTDVLTGINNNKNSLVRIREDEIRVITEGIFNRLQGPKKSLTIQLPYLQVFLDKLYLEITNDNDKKTEAIITNTKLLGMGNIGDVLRDFLENQVKSISEKHSSSDNKVLSETIWKILSPFSTLEGTKQPILVKDIQEQLKNDANINQALVNDCITEFDARRILNATETKNQYELSHDSLAKCIAEKRGDEEIVLLEIRRLITNQVATKEEAREYFTEKQLNFIEPHLAKLNLNNVEKKLIEDSNKAVAKQKNKRKRTVQMLLATAAVVLVIMGLSTCNAIKERKNALNKEEIAIKARKAADSSALVASLAKTDADSSAARAQRDKVAADTNASIAHRALAEAKISATKEKIAKIVADSAKNTALRALNETRIKNLRNAASEYVRLIQDGPSVENNNADKFYDNNYFLAYNYHFDSLNGKLKTKDKAAFKIYNSLRNKLYYDNELYKRIYDFYGIINNNKFMDPVLTQVNESFESNKTDPAAIVEYKRITGQKNVPYARGEKSDLTFCATDDNFIYVYQGLKKIAAISMGAKVTALDFNERKNIIYFGTSGGYIGYVIYTGANKKLQPVFENKLESEITAILFFEYKDDPDVSVNHFLLAAAKTSNTRVYKLDEISLKPDIHLIGNELPYNKSFEQIVKAEFDQKLGKIILKTTKGKGTYYSWDPFTYDLLKKLKKNRGFDPETEQTKALINQPDIKFYQ